MFSKITNTDKLHFTFLFMSFINFIIIIFIGSVMAITIQTVCDMDSAYIFLSRISHLPKNPYSVLLISILAFLFLLVMMWIRRKTGNYLRSSWCLVCCGNCLMYDNYGGIIL